MKKIATIRLIAGVVFLSASLLANGQGRHLIVEQTKTDDKLRITPKSQFADSLALLNYLTAVRFELIEEGWLAASFDSIVWKGDTAVAKLEKGQQYKWANLRIGNVNEEMLSRVGFREKFYQQTAFKPKDVSKLFESLLDHAENSGYPFAQLYLDSIEVGDEEISAAIQMVMSTYIVVDSLIIKGELMANQRVIENHLGIYKNMPYNQKTLNRIPNRLKELPYVKVIKPYEIGMREGEADVYLYLDNKKASNFDGILGILPNSLTGEVVVTGDVQLDLMNALRRGETINMRWQRLQTRTQQLDLRFVYPFVFNLPLGVEFKMNLFRQDTLFSQVNIYAAIPYYFRGGDHIKIYVEDLQANTISPEASLVSQFVDSRSTIFGLGAYTSTLDYRFNPRRGYNIEASAGVGTKRIQTNPLRDPSFYDDIALRSELYNTNLHARYFKPVGKKGTVMIRARGGYFLNDNMFLNEAYRIGGLKSIRGFDEQAIFATGFVIGTIEYRFLFEENSNLFLFFDQGYYENRINQELVSDTPFGFGAGINFETGAGVFSLTYALGRQFDNTIELRSGKIHFGFVSFF